MKKYFIALILIRLVLTAWTPIVADESYYLLWAQNLALSYVDHPGIIAWIGSLFIYIFKEPLIGFRIASLVSYCITSLFLYKTARHFFSQTESKLIILFFMAIPYHYVAGITLQIEQFLILFSSASLYYFICLIKTEQRKFFYPLAIACGLACLAKYTAILMIAGMLFYLLFTPKRHLFNSFEFALSLGMYMIVICPILLWNSQHNWVSFSFHSNRLSSFNGVDSFVTFLLNQILYLSPITVFYFIRSLKKNHMKGIQNSFKYISFMCLLPFSLVSFFTTVYGHWTAVSTLPIVLFIAFKYKEKLKTLCRYQVYFTLFVVIVLIFGTPVTNPINVYNNYKFRQIFKDLTQQYSSTLHIYSDTHGGVGILSYYSKFPIYFPKNLISYPNRWGYSQFALWDKPVVKQGDTILFHGRLNDQQKAIINQHFVSIEDITLPQLTLLEGHISNRSFYLFHHAKAPLDF